MRSVTFAAIALQLLATQAKASCDEATIEHISANGDVIELDDGTEWEVTSASISGWNEGDDVLVCGDKIINKDEDGEQVGVSQR